MLSREPRDPGAHVAHDRLALRVCVLPELDETAATYELDSSHVPMLSQPERVIAVIRTAAKAVQEANVAAF